MKISMRIEKDNFIITAEGDFEAEDNQQLKYALERSTGSYCKKVLIDLANLHNINPAGQRVLLAYLTRLQAHGMPLILCHVNPMVYKALASSGLDKIISIAPTLQDAQTS